MSISHNITDPNFWESLTDVDLELEMHKLKPNTASSAYHLALKEMTRRTNEKQSQERAIQKKIKMMTFVILIFTFLTLLVTIAIFLHSI